MAREEGKPAHHGSPRPPPTLPTRDTLREPGVAPFAATVSGGTGGAATRFKEGRHVVRVEGLASHP